MVIKAWQSMAKFQVRLEDDYYKTLKAFKERNGGSMADVIRYMVDTLRLDELADEEFEEWFNERHGIKR